MSRSRRPYVLAAIIVAVAAITLLAMGRQPVCADCAWVPPWTGARDGASTSQLLADWYSLSHIVHGLLFYAALHWAAPRWSVGWRFAIAVALESWWEVLENTPRVIERYREVTAAAGYVGDSVVNSLADIGMMALGFLAARKLPVWASIVLLLLLELVPLLVIRDNLTLNLVMLLFPSDALRAWQAGA